MKNLASRILLLILLINSRGLLAAEPPSTPPQPPAMQCAAFSPYVDGLNPEYGSHPSAELIDGLLDRLIAETPFRCIMTYGVINGLEQVFAGAESRKLKVIAIIWLDKDLAMNSRSIAAGIAAAKRYPDTIFKLSCGSEVRTRHGTRFDGEILRCIDALRGAGVTQPITTIDTWWEWCDRQIDCRQTLFTDKVDWIGTNIFPWWENKFSGLYPCTTAEQAAEFHTARLSELHETYPDKEIIVTEFGWPNGPNSGTELNSHTGQHCGIASPANQALVVKTTFAQLAERNWSGVVFEAFSESWKPGSEGLFGGFWGICGGQPPYRCATESTPTASTQP